MSSVPVDFSKAAMYKWQMEHLETARAVIDKLGGTTAVSHLTRRKPQHVTNWKASGRLPPDTFLIMRQALQLAGATAPTALWGIVEPADSVA